MSESTLDAIILSDTPPTEDQLRQVVEDYVCPGSRAELAQLDFKVNFDGSTKDWCELLKDAVSMSNAGGGLILFGVDNDGNPVGCAPSLIASLDPAAIVDKLRKYAPQVHIQANPHGLLYAGSQLVFLVVKRGGRIIVFERDGQYTDAISHRPKSAFYAGVVYTRTSGGNAAARQLDLDQMVSYFAEQQVKRMVARIGQVATLPPGTDLIATDPKNPSQGYRLLDQGLGMPVRIVSESDDWSVPLGEVLAPHVPFSDVNAAIAGQVRHWRQVSAGHRVDRGTLGAWYLDRAHINVDENALAFCVLSACHMYGFPMYWAALMSRERLRELITEMMGDDDHPDRNTIPYLVSAFFWHERGDMLAPLAHHKNVAVRSAAQRLAAMPSYDEFVRMGRYRAETCKLGSDQYRLAEFVSNRALAQETFEGLVRRDIQDELTTEKQVAYQLDILLHAPSEPEGT